MASIPLYELEDQLSTVNDAIAALISGKRITTLRIGSASFSRLYEYQEISMEMLVQLRDELRSQISDLTPDEVKFRANATIPLVVGKDIW